MKLAIADRRLALVPLRLEASSTDEGAVLVHPSALLEALTELFNLLWSRAVAVRAAGERDAGGAGDDLADAGAAHGSAARPHAHGRTGRYHPPAVGVSGCETEPAVSR
jgi:hypothetical protein